MISTAVHANTQAILLLTAPLRLSPKQPPSRHLTPSEYRALARLLHERSREPADLLGPDAATLASECAAAVEPGRLEQLLGRGFLLAQAVERWQARGIWVASRADAAIYPPRWRTRLRDAAPPVLYGCGDPALLRSGGLAVVGSRDADPSLLEYAEAVGRLVAEAKRPVISGGARGIDQVAVRGALAGGGSAVAVLADGLERAAVQRDYRGAIMSGQLVLVSPYEPGAGFHVGQAMQRNKLIYALADAALVVSVEADKGGTWAGAVEQLDKLRLVRVYVRDGSVSGNGADALRSKGAMCWPESATAAAVAALLETGGEAPPLPRQTDLPWSRMGRGDQVREAAPALVSASDGQERARQRSPAEELLAKVQELLVGADQALTEGEAAELLGLTKPQARAWLKRLAEDGVLEKRGRPARYRRSSPPADQPR